MLPMQQSPQCLCAQLALAYQALCVSNPNRHDTQNQSTYLAEGCIPLQVRPFPCIAYKTSFKTALAPPALLSSIPAGAITKKHPSDRRGAYIPFSDFSWRLHGLRASVPIGARTTASGSGGNPNLIHYRYVPLHDSAPYCRDNHRSPLIVLDGQTPYGQHNIPSGSAVKLSNT